MVVSSLKSLVCVSLAGHFYSLMTYALQCVTSSLPASRLKRKLQLQQCDVKWSVWWVHDSPLSRLQSVSSWCLRLHMACCVMAGIVGHRMFYFVLSTGFIFSPVHISVPSFHAGVSIISIPRRARELKPRCTSHRRPCNQESILSSHTSDATQHRCRFCVDCASTKTSQPSQQ